MSAIKLGVLTRLEEGPEATIQKVKELGFPSCQIVCWQADLYSDAQAERLRASAAANGVEITTIWVGLPGRHVWDFLEGPTTIGLVPEDLRAERLAVLKAGAAFAAKVGVPSITTHVGFIPENPTDPRYGDVLSTLR